MTHFVFFGTPYVARDTLAYLHDAGYTPTLVVSNPDAKRGRKQILTPSETKVWALEHDIPVLTPERLDSDACAQITAYNCAHAIVVAYGKILPEPLIDAFSGGIFNIHYSLLPRYRGASPVESALRNGDTKTGVTIQKMVHALDAGDILATAEVAIDVDDTTPTLRKKLIETGSRLLVDTLPDIFANTYTTTPQDHSAATYAPKIVKADGEITPNGNDLNNWNKYRAYKEWPGVFFYSSGKRIKVTDATLDASGAFSIHSVIPEGKKEMAYKDFLKA